MPHSRFLSWPDEDQDKAIAFLEYEAMRCSKCGSFPHEWLDPTTKMPVWPPPYAVGSLRCLGCVEIELEQKVAGDNEKGLYFYLKHWEDSDGGP